MPEVAQIQYGRLDNVLAIKVEGPCTAVQAARVQRLLHEYMTASIAEIYFDLSRACYMDSSFAGRLLSLALQNREEAGPRICLYGMPAAVEDALRKMHVLHFFHVEAGIPAAISEWMPFSARDTELDELAELVIEAHEKLMEADPRNAETFGRVVEGLHEHLQPPSE